jgi:catalase
LFDELRQRVAAGQVAFNFNLEIAQTGDNLDKATVPLPEGRTKVTLGQLRVTSVSPDAVGSCLAISLGPNRMPKGVEGPGDPMLTARSAPYAVSLGRRLGGGAKQPDQAKRPN